MEEIKEVLFVVNPISGDMDKNHLITAVKSAVAKIKSPLEIYTTQGKGDILNIKDLISSRNPSRVLVAGGDGSIKMVVEAMQGFEVPLGILPAGSANGLALNLRIPNNVEKQLQIALGRNFVNMDLLKLNGEPCLHMSDLGINAELIRHYAASPIRGKFGYLLQSIPTLINSKYPFQFEIETGDKVLKKEGILLAFANAKKYGTGANVNPAGKINDGKFEILLFKNFDFLEMLKTLRNEVDLDPEFIEIMPVTKAKVTCTNAVAFQIDGEYIGEKEEIKAGISPEKVKVAVPEELLSKELAAS